MQSGYKEILLVSGIAAAVFLGMKYILPLVVPFLLAWALARLLLPAVVWLEKKLHWKRMIAGGVLLVLFGAAAGALLYLLGSRLILQICNLAANFDRYMGRAQELMKLCCTAVEKNVGIRAQAVEEFLYDNMVRLKVQIQSYTVPNMLKNSIACLLSALKWLGAGLIVFVSFMMILKDYDEMRESLKKYGIYERVRKISSAMQSLGGAWLRAQMIIILAVTVICVLGLWLLNCPYALLMGILIGLLDALPFVGTGTILIPWGAFYMFTGKFWYGVCLIVLFFVTNTLREFLEPKLIGERIGIYPLAMVAAVYVGLYLFGVFGVVLGPISLMLIIEIRREIRQAGEK